ncbi:hypothetical protein CCACVL1_26070 [Corchorus capsularis]|uniref:Uncharacterized protein n=1 Tax=Corchorus capsularis TaxID=210143 RepID=A0A1R3GG11_COCAP|nr:hypothetical protein CCACVL1_26070 [Corchorus capsularis]
MEEKWQRKKTKDSKIQGPTGTEEWENDRAGK